MQRRNEYYQIRIGQRLAVMLSQSQEAAVMRPMRIETVPEMCQRGQEWGARKVLEPRMVQQIKGFRPEAPQGRFRSLVL